jgi:predicted secreted protein
MGNAHALRGRLTPALILAALLALAVIVTLGLTAAPASATSTFTLCSSCHNYSPGDAFHTKTTHSKQTCTKCHVNGVNAAGLVSSACASCHGTAATIAADPNTSHPTSSCGSCHAAPSPTPTATATTTPTPTPTATAVATTLTAKVSPTITKLGKKVKVSGTAGPVASLAGAKIAFKLQRKVGTKWVKMKAPASATVTPTGTYTWSYKAVKKGAHKVTLSIKATTAFTAKTMSKSFKVK